MSVRALKTSIVLLIFNRPDTTEKVFEIICEVKPSRLFVIADGPRPEHLEDVEKCAAARSIIERVDWDCEVLKNYSDTNMGLKSRVSTGLDWVFSFVEEAIILEDDCLPHPSFFEFCETLLERYRYDERVMMIGGTNVLKQWKLTLQSYCFSYFNSCWGWATWRRAWNCYDIEMKFWQEPEVRNRIRHLLADDKQYQACEKIFDRVYHNEINSWALRWFFARLSHSGLSVTPSVNLVSNVGFSKDATHHKSSKDPLAFLPVSPMSFPLKEPPEVVVDREFENLRFKKTWGRQKTLWEILRTVKHRILKNINR